MAIYGGVWFTQRTNLIGVGGTTNPTTVILRKHRPKTERGTAQLGQ